MEDLKNRFACESIYFQSFFHENLLDGDLVTEMLKLHPRKWWKWSRHWKISSYSKILQRYKSSSQYFSIFLWHFKFLIWQGSNNAILKPLSLPSDIRKTKWSWAKPLLFIKINEEQDRPIQHSKVVSMNCIMFNWKMLDNTTIMKVRTKKIKALSLIHVSIQNLLKL